MRRGMRLWGLHRVGFALSLLLLALPVRLALANGGPHGNYSLTTDACAGCHRAHTATAPDLLTSTNTALCLTCHGPGSTGSSVDVLDGVYLGSTYGTPGGGLNGGGFSFAKQDTTLSGTPVSGTVTSRHAVQGTASYTATATMWGAGDLNTGPGSTFDLYCTSCHDPHGSSNYRLIKDIINGLPVTVTETDETNKSYTTPTYYTTTVPGGQWQISSFCAACHTRYDATASASGEISSTDAIFAYRHRVDAPSGSAVGGITYTFPSAISLPVSTVNGAPPTTSPDNRSMVCLTCHYAHGSAATMGSGSGAVAWPDGSMTVGSNARSSLLRVNNRGVCESCHRK